MQWRCSSPETSWSTAQAANRCFGTIWCPGPARGTTARNTLTVRLEYAIVVTFLYGQSYECNEHCKYYKNAENLQYKFIPAVDRTYMMATSAT